MKLFPFKVFKIKGRSMFPTLKPGDFVLIFKTKNVRKGDIVIVKNPSNKSRVIVKRVRELRGNKVFLVGDNAEESTDSRDFGELSIDDIVGKVVFVI